MPDKNFSSKGSFRKLQNELKKSFEETIKKASTEAFDDVEIEGEVDGKKVKVKGSAIKNEVQKQLAKNLEEVTISPTVNIEPEFKMAKGADKKVENLVKDIASNTVIAPKVDLSKAINSFEDLKAIVSEFEEVYNRIQRGTLKRQDPTYIGDELKTSFRDVISDDYRDTVDWDIKDEGLLDKQKEKLLEIYKLYKNIQSAIKNNKGFYKGEQYDTSDLKDLEKVFKSYAQAYYEMSLEIQDADKRINEELAMDGFTSNIYEEVESLESITSKMTKQFKGYVQEVIENSDAVRKNNIAYKEEQQQLQESNALLKERAQLLRDKILDTVKNKRGEDAYDKARYALPYLYDDYDMYDDWGVDSWRDEKIDVLKEVAEALGVEIPQAAEKAKESLKEISQTEDISDVSTPISEELEKENSKAEEVLETFKKIKAYLDGIESDEHSDLYGFQDLKGKDFNAIFNAFKNFDFDLLKEIGFSEEEINESRVAFERIIAEVKETQSLGRKVKNQDKWDAYESEFGQPPEVRVIDLADDWLNVVDKLINKIQELGTTEKETFQEIPKYVQKSEDEIYESALKLAQNEEGIFEKIAQQEINLANKTSGETKKAYAEMATATYKMFKEGAYESEIEDKIRSTDVLIKELQGRIETETNPEVILSLNEQLDEAKIKILALQEVFKDIRPKGVFNTSDFEDRDVLEKYSRKHRENYTIGQSNYSIASEDREYWQTLTKGISSEKELTDAIVKRKEEMVALTMEMSKAEDQEHALMDARDALPYGKERDAATAAYDEAFDHTQTLTEKYNEIRQELYNLIQLQNNWGKSIQDASEINSVFMYSEWREEEQALYTISDEIEAIAKLRLQDAEAARQEADEVKNETETQEENTKAARKRLTERARYYLNKANEGKIDYSETEAQFNRIISEMQQLGESTAHVEEQFAKAKATFNMDGVAKEAEKGAEKVEAEAESFSENAEKAQEAAQAKGKFNEVNKETQQEADKSTDKVKEETEAVDEATLAFDGYYKNQRNKVGDDSWGYTERVGYAQDLIRNISHDDQGNLLVSESLRTNYEKLEKEVLKVDKAIVNLKSAMADMSRQGIDTTESQENLNRLELYLSELEGELNKYYSSSEYMPSSNQQQIFANVRQEAAAFEESRLKQKEYVRQFRETESERKKAESLDTSKAIKLDAWDKLADKISNDTHLLAVFGQKMNNVGDAILNATNTNELRLASAAMQQLTADVNEEVSALKKMESEQDSLSSDLYGQMADKIKEIYTLREKNVSLDKTSQKGSTELAQNETRINELLQETVALRQRINNESAQQLSKDQEISDLARDMNKSLANTVQRNLGGQIDDIESGITNYSKKINEVLDSPKFTDDFKQRFKDLDASLELVVNNLKSIKAQGAGAFDAAEVEALKTAYDDLSVSIEKALQDKKLSENKSAALSSLAKLRKSIEDIEARNSAMGRSFREQFDNLKLEIDTAKSNERVEQLKAEIVNLEAELIRTGNTGKSAFQKLREAIGTANTQFLMRYFSLYDWIRYGRQAITTIEELDYALVDLKKTSTMTSSELKDFYFDANDVAKRMGVTTKAIIEQAASWSRLGYSSKEASAQMAELSSQFASISPGMSTEDAQTGLVSLMKAYEVSTDEVERKLMDNINVLGNKFAETNDDIIEGMKRAGATLSAIGTSVEDSFALFTGAQEIIQNAETVGTALKTLSLRIRGFDEETEEMSDDVIAAVGKVASLTKVASNGYAGVSLWADAAQTQYRSLKDYLGDIAEIWDEIDAKSQTDLLNNLFGKRGASVGSSILKNFSQVEKALEEMENAAGAADAEMTIIQESIDYKLNNLRQTWVGILQQLIDNGMLGELIDLLTNISEAIGKVVTSIGPLPTLIGGISLIELVKNLDKIADFFRTTKIVDQIKALYGLTLGAKWISPDALAPAAFLEAVQNGMYDTSIGLVRVEQNTSALNSTFLKLIKSPLLPWISGIGAALIAVGVAIYKTKQANDELRKSAKELGNQYKESKEDLSDYKTQIEQLYETINDENVSYEDSKAAREKLLGIQDQLIEKYGKEYESINLITDAINGEVDALDRLTDKQWTEAMNQFNEQNLKGWDWMNRVVHGASDNIGVMLKDMEDYTIKVNFHANDDFAKQVAELYDGTLRYDTNQYYVELNGNLDDVYDKLLNIQELARDNGMSNDIVSRIGKQTSDVKDLLDQYSQFYSAYVFNERIFGNEYYEGVYNNLVKEYQNYRDRLTDADEEGAEKSKAVILQQYYDLYDQLADEDGNLSSENLGIYKALAGLVPELQEELDKNVLRVHLNVDPDEVKEESNKIREAILMFGSEEEILNYKISEEGNGPLDQFYKTIIEYAQAHQIDVQTLIDLYRELYGLEGLSVRNSRGMVNRFQEANGIANYDDKGIRLTNADYIKGANALSDEDYQTALLFNDEQWKKVNEEMTRIQESTQANIDEAELYRQAVEKVVEEWKEVHEESEKLVFDQSKFSEQVNKLDALQSAYNTFAQNVANKETKINLDISDVEELREEFGNIEGFDFDEFELVITADTSGADEIQKAFDSALTAYANNKIALEGITEANKDMIRTQLEMEGATAESAQKFVDAQLARAQAEELVAEKGIELNAVTSSQISALLKLGEITPAVAQQLALLAMQEQLVNGVSLQTTDDVQALMNLARVAGFTAAEIQVLNEVMSMIDQADAIKDKSGVAATEIRKAAEQKLNNFNALVQEKLNANMSIAFDYDGAVADAGKAGGEAADAYVEAYQKEKEKLERDRDMGKKFAHVA